MLVEALDLVALVDGKSGAAQADAVEAVGLAGFPSIKKNGGTSFVSLLAPPIIAYRPIRVN